ncbi:hypothetical protein Taro_039817 [Colocasia esculenta]|uniref:Uncharacterized protein n=1 Tax=Colocasia esculenta TaxID=4460 RepID=A0A843WSL8_COLES|nr:hypothetical protein [Colocasia esculenta]
MEEDDEFGDLYADVLLSAAVTPGPSEHPARSENNDGDGGPPDPDPGRVFPGVPSGSASSKLPYRLQVQPVVPGVQEGGDEDRVLGQATVTEEQTPDWRGEEDGCSFPGDSGCGAAGGLPAQQKGGVFGGLKEEEVAGGSVEVPPPEEVRDDEEGVGVAEGGGASLQGRGVMVTSDIDEGAADSDQEPAIPGLSVSVAPVRSGVLDGTARGEEKVSRSDDWDSDSEDDLQIVLNDDKLGLAYGNRNVAAGVEDDDDDDEDGEDDLVIVADHDQQHPHPQHLQVAKEQEWDEESAHQPLDGEGKEKSEVTRENGEMGASPLAKTGFGSHGCHDQHHSQFKACIPMFDNYMSRIALVRCHYKAFSRLGNTGIPPSISGQVQQAYWVLLVVLGMLLVKFVLHLPWAS